MRLVLTRQRMDAIDLDVVLSAMPAVRVVHSQQDATLIDAPPELVEQIREALEGWETSEEREVAPPRPHRRRPREG